MTQPTMQERAFALWVEIWTLASERWPPNAIPAGWRVYEHLKQALAGTGSAKRRRLPLPMIFTTVRTNGVTWNSSAIISTPLRRWLLCCWIQSW